MSEPEHEPPSLTEVLATLRDQVQMLTDLNRQLPEAQRKSPGLFREFFLTTRTAWPKSSSFGFWRPLAFSPGISDGSAAVSFAGGRLRIMKNPVNLEKKHLLQTYARSPLVIERGKGCWVWDTKGNKYLDFVAGLGVNALGHAHPRILKALREQAS